MRRNETQDIDIIKEMQGKKTNKMYLEFFDTFISQSSHVIIFTLQKYSDSIIGSAHIFEEVFA